MRPAADAEDDDSVASGYVEKLLSGLHDLDDKTLKDLGLSRARKRAPKKAKMKKPAAQKADKALAVPEDWQVLLTMFSIEMLAYLLSN